MRDITAWFILIAPLVILTMDGIVWWFCSSGCTITGVVREWAMESPWPEALYVLGVVVLYLHLFRGWL